MATALPAEPRPCVSGEAATSSSSDIVAFDASGIQARRLVVLAVGAPTLGA
jgi:hypothetical protein